MDSRRDRVLMVALIAIVALLALLATPSDESDPTDTRASTLRDTPAGARALYLALDELDVPAGRRYTPWVDADSLAGRGTLVLLAPAEPPTPAELAALKRWVTAGGTLLYAARPRDATLDTLGLVLEPLVPDSVPFSRRADWPGLPATPAYHRWTGGTGSVEGFRWAFADSSRALAASEVVLSTRGGDAVVARLRVGRGTVVAWSDAGPLRNRALRRSGAAAVFARAAADLLPPGDTLRFDEYHHGYRGGGSAVDATLRFLRRAPAGHLALQLAAVAVLLLLALGWRFGSPVPPPPARRRSPLEHVEALAGAYRQAGARATARRLLLAGLARRLGRHSPRDAREEGELLERLGTHLPVGREAARGVQQEWKKGDRADLVALSRDVDRLLREVKRT